METGGYQPDRTFNAVSGTISFNAASSGTAAGAVYQNFDSVRAPSIDVVVWRRTA